MTLYYTQENNRKNGKFTEKGQILFKKGKFHREIFRNQLGIVVDLPKAGPHRLRTPDLKNHIQGVSKLDRQTLGPDR